MRQKGVSLGGAADAGQTVVVSLTCCKDESPRASTYILEGNLGRKLLSSLGTLWRKKEPTKGAAAQNSGFLDVSLSLVDDMTESPTLIALPS